MSSDPQFTAQGPAAVGFQTDSSQISIGADLVGNEFGARIQCTNGPDGSTTSNGTPTRFGILGISKYEIGVIGIGPTGVSGISVGVPNSDSVAQAGISGTGGLNGVYGTGQWYGVHGKSGDRNSKFPKIGLAGVGVYADADTIQVSDENPQQLGCGVGLYAVSKANRAAVFANRQPSDRDYGDLFIESSVIGGEFDPVGLNGGKVVAQINIRPTEHNADPPSDGKMGDLFAQWRGDAGDDAELWFCLKGSDYSKNQRAQWGQVQFSEFSPPRP